MSSQSRRRPTRQPAAGDAELSAAREAQSAQPYRGQWVQRKTRTTAIALCIVGVGWLTAACSPAVEGTSGVRLGDEDQLIAVLAWCSGFEPTQLTVYTASLDGGVDDAVITLKRTGDAPAGSYLEIDILNPPPGWNSEQTADLDDNGTYEIRAWNGDGGSRVSSFPFQMEELRSSSAHDGTVLTKTYVGEDSREEGGYESIFLTPQEFREHAERKCDE